MKQKTGGKETSEQLSLYYGMNEETLRWACVMSDSLFPMGTEVTTAQGDRNIFHGEVCALMASRNDEMGEATYCCIIYIHSPYCALLPPPSYYQQTKQLSYLLILHNIYII